MKHQKVCVFVTLLICVGVIATILAVLMIPEIGGTENNGNDEEIIESGEEDLVGEYVYAEIPSIGKMKGKKSEFGAAIFAGIPFGQPPVGELRWAKPLASGPLVYEGEHYDATYSRKACIQNCSLPSPDYVCPAVDDMNEDCLYLNVYLPSVLTKKVETSEGYYYTLVDSIRAESYPVMVFLYGGAFIAGGNGVPLYDGQFIAEKGEVIVVVVNYRLGPFGFFYQDNGNSEAALGNYAIWDQIEALRWVKNWIPYLGGSNEDVTLFGESAGAQSTAVHLVNEHSKDLFDRAILESNPFGLNFKTVEEAQTLGEKFVNHVRAQSKEFKCTVNDVACLRNIPAEELLEHYNSFSYLDQFNPDSISQLFEPWAPIIDDDLLTQHPFYYFKQGKSHAKPMIFGFTNNEAMFFVAQALFEPSKSNQLYNILLNVLFGNRSSEVFGKYPAECPPLQNQPGYDECDNRIVIDKLVSDYMFTCPNRHVFNEVYYGNSNAKVWAYTFDQVWSFPEFWEEYTACYDITCHAAELPYLFDMDELTQFRFTDEEQQLAEKLIAYWTNFAKYEDPNDPEESFARKTDQKKKQGNKSLSPVEYWPRLFEGSNSSHTEHNTRLLTGREDETVLKNFQEDSCNFWDSIDLYLKDNVKISGPRLEEFKRYFVLREKENF